VPQQHEHPHEQHQEKQQDPSESAPEQKDAMVVIWLFLGVAVGAALLLKVLVG
jgi:hypothetical protein